jgi:hypothetical protein
MSEIRYNQASTFSRVLIAGMFASQLLPMISERNGEESKAKSVRGVAYRTASNTATYSHFGSPVTGEYIYATADLEQTWITPDLAEFLRNSPHVTSEALDHLLVAIRATYGNVQIDTTLHTDPEEGWIKPVITVHSGIEDFNQLLDVEDNFFSKATADPVLLATLPFVVVSQS